MRIRLLIERNELPSVSVLWSFPPTQLSSTIAQFLENVNVRFPLERNTWGLEDYTVTLGGYEAQHYTKVGEVFKEDDEVVIKPLLFAEARARTIGGRAQITADGRKLLDGVPFGKPLLKRMRRPEVDIPPARKRARLEPAAEEDDDEGAMVRFEEVINEDDEDEDEDDEDDEDFEDAEDDQSEDELEDSDDDGDAEVEEADWDHVTKWRVPIRAIYSSQCCLRKKYLVLVWDADEQHFNLTCGEDPVRVPGSDKVFTIGKKDVAVCWSTVDWSIERVDHRAILKAAPNAFTIIEFKDGLGLSECFLRLMEATKETMKSVPISAEEMQHRFPEQKKLLLAARAKVWANNSVDSDDTGSSSDASESGLEEETEQVINPSSRDSSDDSDSDSSSGSSSSESDESGKNEGEDDDSDSDSDSSSDSSGSDITWSGIETSETAPPAPPPAVQGAAKKTKERNIRRREAARLKHLKKVGELPESTTLQQMQEWLRTGTLPPVPHVEASGSQTSTEASKDQDSVARELEKKRQQLISDINGGGIDVSTESKIAVPANMHPPQVRKPKNKSIASSPLLEDDDDRPEEIAIATEPVTVYPATVSTPTAAAKDSPALSSLSAAAAKRRQDMSNAEEPTEGPKRVSAAHRLIYGSLGLRAPKTQADKDALQEKLASRMKKVAAEVAVAEEEIEDEDSEAWRERVMISAVECLDEGVELSEPPFPFQQKWDPQYWSQNVKKRNASRGGQGGRNKKRKNNGGELVEVYDKYNQDGGGDALNYDDPVDDDEEYWDDGEDWQDGALLGAEDVKDEDDGFPALPKDLTTLASLTEADAQVGDFVVFTEMACSDATGWQPKIVTTIGCLDSNGEDAWSVRVSTRGEKEYDEKGNRIYKKFEMEGFDDDDIRQMAWSEMMDVKLLLRPAQAIDQAEAAGVEEQIQSQLEGEMGKEASSIDQ